MPFTHRTQKIGGDLFESASIEDGLKATLSRLPDRERLALKCMLARDVFHIAVLYETFIRSSQTVQGATGSIHEAVEEVDEQSKPQPILVFRQWLFG
jgi:hypothetical protein